MKCDVTTLDNKSAGTIDLDAAVFGLPRRDDIVQRMISWQLAKRRAGTHKTKTVSEVAGSTRKIYRQKGTGRARHRTRKAPQFRGGAATFGPVVRSHATDLPKKVRKLALKTALSAKRAEGRLKVIEAASLESHKTKTLALTLGKLGWSRVLFIDGPEVDINFARAASNLVGVDVLPQQGANVYDIVRCDTLVLTRAAVEHLEARLK
ncbi:MAG: 50S ribosomal protein L4 [Alphaproteobacteria bacterium]